MDIEEWLRGLGLQQYVAIFRDNAIDAEVLPELTEADLEKLGILLGHRKRLLKAIAVLTAPKTAERVAPAGSAPSQGDRVGRRQLTVLFADLVDSTGLSVRLDPEEMGDLLRAYQNTVAVEVVRFDGHVAKFMGDGVLAYFGWPKAHEDDAERAVRTGLAVVAAVPHLRESTDQPLAVRVGIATGLVVVGELIGDHEARERAVVGETPNLAARLQTLAEPNGVVISRSTHRLVDGLFDLADLGSHEIKGFDRRVRAWRVIGESQAESRFEALHAATLTRSSAARKSLPCYIACGPRPGTAKARSCCFRASQELASRA